MRFIVLGWNVLFIVLYQIGVNSKVSTGLGFSKQTHLKGCRILRIKGLLFNGDGKLNTGILLIVDISLKVCLAIDFSNAVSICLIIRKRVFVVSLGR